MTAFANVEAIRAAKTTELVAFWNEHNEKQITKFADRLTAEKRCEGLMTRLNTAAMIESAKLADALPEDGGFKAPADARPEVEEEDEPADLPVVTGNPFGALIPKEKTEEVGEEGGEPDRFIKASTGRSNREGVRASWNDPEVREARQTRDSVVVTLGEDPETTSSYKSTRAAFRALGLPDSKHIRFRMKLKEDGKATFEHEEKAYNFEINTIID